MALCKSLPLTCVNDILTLNQCANVAGGNVGGPLALALGEPFLLWRIETAVRTAFRIEEIWKLLWTCGQINKALTLCVKCEAWKRHFSILVRVLVFQCISLSQKIQPPSLGRWALGVSVFDVCNWV